MSVADVFYFGVLVICWTRLCVALQVSHGLMLDQDPTITGDHHTMSSTEARDSLEVKNIPNHAPCFMDDMFTALRDGVGNNGELTNHSLPLFGICTVSDNPSGSVLLELAKEASRHQRNSLEVLQPAGVHFAEENERGTLTLAFDLPHSPLLKLNPVLLLVFKKLFTDKNLDVTFTSQSLQPNTQSVCISGETHYIMLTGKASEGNIHQKWRISFDTKSPEMNENLTDILIGGNSGGNISLTPLLLFYGGRGTESRHVSGSFLASQTSFLCELKQFLGDVMPQDRSDSPPLQLSSLETKDPLTLGLSTSETLLAGLINSSALTIFSFTSCCSMLQVHHGELALSPELLEELRQRLDQTVIQIMQVLRVEEVGHRAVKRLRRLRELSAFHKKEPAAGESQYCAFLLLKALQTVARTYEVQRGQRAARADPNNPARESPCGLRSLTVSLEKHLVAPNTANIKNCHGSCAFPLVNPTNHAVLLNFHIESGHVGERAPCCVPLAYEEIEVVDFRGGESELRLLEYMVAKECGCR